MGILKHHGLQRRVPRPLPDSEQGCVDARTAIKPCSGGVGHSLVKIIVTMPLDQLVRHARMGMKGIDDALNTSWNYRAGIVHTIAHCVAGSDLDRDSILLHQLGQLKTEGHHIAIDVRPCNVFQMASGADSLLKALSDHAQIMLHGLPSRHLQLQKDMIIRAAHQNPRLLHADGLHQLEVLLAGSDPAGDLRKFISSLHAFIHRVLILFAVQKELAGADHPLRAA